MAMDVLERLNRRFGAWYEGLFGGEGRDLRPRDVLRRILAAMEDNRREGLDGKVYVPNVYTLQIAVAGDDERHYLRTFLSADELAAAVAQAIEQHGYSVRGALLFAIEEIDAGAAPVGERLRVHCRFDAAVQADAPFPQAGPMSPASSPAPASYTPVQPVPSPDEEPKTVPAIRGGALASLVAADAQGRTIDVFPVSPRGVALGRGRHAGNDIVLDADTMVSKRHARVACERGDWMLYDEGSTNGTFLNEQMVPPGVGARLRGGDVVRIGDTRLTFQPPAQQMNFQSGDNGGAVGSGDPTPEEKPGAAAPPRRDPDTRLGGGASGGGVFRLVGGDGETYPLASRMSIGRSLTGDITLIGTGVATNHARVEADGSGVHVIDLGTAGGTTVNGERIPAHLRVALYHGDQVSFGEVMMRLERAG